MNKMICFACNHATGRSSFSPSLLPLSNSLPGMSTIQAGKESESVVKEAMMESRRAAIRASVDLSKVYGALISV